MNHHAVIYEDAAGEWRYRIVGGNGETIAQSEGYTRRTDARRAVTRNHPDVEDVRTA